MVATWNPQSDIEIVAGTPRAAASTVRPAPSRR